MRQSFITADISRDFLLEIAIKIIENEKYEILFFNLRYLIIYLI